jgi:methionyl-tRNA formyltransferase
MNILFLGSPNSAAICLEKIVQKGLDVAGVITRTDKPRGRSKNPLPCPVKTTALKHDLLLYQPPKVSRGEFMQKIKEMEIDLGVVVAFGEILSDEFLNAFPKGCINLHFSLLPRWRGPAPVLYAILKGDRMAGVTTMYVSRKVDTGDIIYQRELPIDTLDNTATLDEKLTYAGADLLVKTITDIALDRAPRIVQDENAATYAKILTKSDGLIDWNRPAQELHNHVRAMNPWPGAFSYIDIHGESKRLKIIESRVVWESGKPGQVIGPERDFIVACERDALSIKKLQLEGKKPMTTVDFLRGHPVSNETILGINEDRT